MRRGFTLVEVVVALVLFQIAMLALTATSITASRDLEAANRRARGRELAEHRVAILRAAACHSLAAGQSAAPGIREFWSVTAHGALRVVTDSVELTFSRKSEHFAIRAWVYCDQ